MYERGFWDTVPLWPTALWPVLASAILYSLFSLNRSLQTQGVLHEHLFKAPLWRAVYGTFYLVASVVDTLIEIYTLIIVGWTYLIALVAGLAVFAVARVIIGLTPYAHYVYPIVYVAIIISYLVLLGIISDGRISDINQWIVGHLPWLARS